MLKERSLQLMDQSNAPKQTWFLAQKYVADVYNITSNPALNYRIPLEVATGETQTMIEMNALAFQDVVPIVRYIQNKKLGDQPEFKRVLLYCQGESPSSMRRIFNIKSIYS